MVEAGTAAGWAPAAEPVPAGRRSAPFLLGALGVLVIAGLLVSWAGSGWTTPARVRDIEAARHLANDPEAAPTFSGSPPDGPWVDLRGRWAHDDGDLRLLSPPGLVNNLTVVDTGADGRIGVTLDPLRDNAGLVFRVADGRNYWAVVPSRPRRAWVLIRVRNGRPVGAAAASGILGDRARVEVRLDGPIIEVWLNGRFAMGTIDERLARQTRAGVGARGPAAGAARWLDFRADDDG